MSVSRDRYLCPNLELPRQCTADVAMLAHDQYMYSISCTVYLVHVWSRTYMCASSVVSPCRRKRFFLIVTVTVAPCTIDILLLVHPMKEAKQEDVSKLFQTVSQQLDRLACFKNHKEGEVCAKLLVTAQNVVKRIYSRSEAAAGLWPM